LWEAAATAGLPRFDPPEIAEGDLSGLLLDCAIWGVSDPLALRWIDPPPAAAISEARKRLASLGATDADGRPTAHGRAVAALPLPPRLGHMLIAAAERGWARTAAEVAVLLSERGLGGSDADVEARLRRWRSDRGQRAESARRLAERWEGLIKVPVPLAGGAGGGDNGERSRHVAISSPPLTPPASGRGDDLPACLALAFPDRISKRRESTGENWISAGGRGFRLDPASPLARSEWLAVAETQGAASGARILSAAPIDQASVEALFADRIELVRSVRFDPATGGVETRRERRLGAIRLGGGHDDAPDAYLIEQALAEGVRQGGLSLLPWPESAMRLRRRAAFVQELDPSIDDLSDEALLVSADEWLPGLVEGRRRLSDISADALLALLDARLGWKGRRALDRLAPEMFVSPAGSRHEIDYQAEGGPAVELRVQALFGLGEHPAVAGGRVPLVLRLTSPAGRPIQTTRDLPGFWAGSWAAVAKEMRGRYPRHPWPDDPAAADPTLRTKKAAART
jgi:ATP-dependent helicase HrpB